MTHRHRRRRRPATRSPGVLTRRPAGIRSSPERRPIRQPATTTSPEPHARRRPYRVAMPNSRAVELLGSVGQGNRVADGSAQAALVGDVDIDDVAPGRCDNVLGLWDGTSEQRPIHLDQQLLTLDAEREASAVTDLTETASQDLGGEEAQPHVFDSKLSV